MGAHGIVNSIGSGLRGSVLSALLEPLERKLHDRSDGARRRSVALHAQAAWMERRRRAAAAVLSLKRRVELDPSKKAGVAEVVISVHSPYDTRNVR